MVLELKSRISIVVADDDEDDCLLVRDALREWNAGAVIVFMRDGQALMEYLHSCEMARKNTEKPCPDLILLDLNMPRKSGREALQEIRADTRLKTIPIVILSTSSDQGDITFCHRNGANSFITKAPDFESLVEKMKAFGTYWFGAVALPEMEVVPERWMRAEEKPKTPVHC